MPVQNISAVFAAQALADLKADIEALDAQFPALVTLTDDERRRLQRVAAGREAFCITAINGAAGFPTVVPNFMSLAEWTKDETYCAQLGELELMLAARLAKCRDTRAAVGAQRYRQSRKFYEATKSAKEDVPGLQALYETLSGQFEGQGGTGEEGGEGENGGDGGSGGGTPPPNP